MDLVEPDEIGVTLLKIVEALKGALVFSASASVELNKKGCWWRRAGRETMDSNISLPSMLISEHFLAVSAICFDRSDLA